MPEIRALGIENEGFYDFFMKKKNIDDISHFFHFCIPQRYYCFDFATDQGN